MKKAVRLARQGGDKEKPQGWGTTYCTRAAILQSARRVPLAVARRHRSGCCGNCNKNMVLLLLAVLKAPIPVKT
jgi:hypothetical protein